MPPYISWQIKSVDDKEHKVSIYVDNDAELCLDNPGQNVSWGRLKLDDATVLKMGSTKQPILEKSGDNLRIDWGYIYLVSTENQNPKSAIGPDDEIRYDFINNNELPASDNFDMPCQGNHRWPVQSLLFNLGKVGSQEKEVYAVLAYDDIYSIEFFNRKLQAYWKRNGKSINNVIKERLNNYQSLMNACEEFDNKLISDLTLKGGKDYASICALAYRQVFAAHKLAVDIDGTANAFSKRKF